MNVYFNKHIVKHILSNSERHRHMQIKNVIWNYNILVCNNRLILVIILLVQVLQVQAS